MRNPGLTIYVLLAALLITVGCSRLSQQAGPPAAIPADAMVAEAGLTGEATLFVPCGMIIPLRAVMDKFEADHPGVKLNGVFDNAVVLGDRIMKKGEKADVFVSPGSTEIGRLEEAGLIDPSSKTAIADFELVVITQREWGAGLAKPEDLMACDTLSMPDPAINSTGASGREALMNLGLWERLKPKMVFTRHAIESHTLVASGKSDAGIAYRNCPLETNPEKLSKTKVKVAFSFPEDSYEKQQCLVAVLKDSRSPAAAKAFVEAIASPEDRQILADNGMTGCLDTQGSGVASADGAVNVRAFYPGNPGHAHLRELIEGLPGKYDGRVTSEFVDFTSDEGFDKWQAAGLSCGAVLINDQQTWTYDQDGELIEVTFKMGIGGEWTEDDLYAVIEKLLQESETG